MIISTVVVNQLRMCLHTFKSLADGMLLADGFCFTSYMHGSVTQMFCDLLVQYICLNGKNCLVHSALALLRRIPAFRETLTLLDSKKMTD